MSKYVFANQCKSDRFDRANSLSLPFRFLDPFGRPAFLAAGLLVTGFDEVSLPELPESELAALTRGLVMLSYNAFLFRAIGWRGEQQQQQVVGVAGVGGGVGILGHWFLKPTHTPVIVESNVNGGFLRGLLSFAGDILHKLNQHRTL